MPGGEVLAAIRPTPVRRALAVGILLALGGLLVWLAMTLPQAGLGWQALLLVIGAGALWLADRTRRATALSLELRGDALWDSAGNRLCMMDQVIAVERGAFAFKPSNGFLLRLTTGGSRHWAPGLWWRLGRRIGVGGAVRAGEAKVMAEAIAGLVAMRMADGTQDPSE